jgi:hypothetical protein
LEDKVNKEIDEKQMVLTTDKAYDVLYKFLNSEDANPEIGKRLLTKIAVAQTVIKAHVSQKLADAKNAATHVGIATAVLDNIEERKKYLSFTLPGLATALPESQKPEELKQIDNLQGKVGRLEAINNNLLVKLDDMTKERDELRFKVKE